MCMRLGLPLNKCALVDSEHTVDNVKLKQDDNQRKDPNFRQRPCDNAPYLSGKYGCLENPVGSSGTCTSLFPTLYSVKRYPGSWTVSSTNLRGHRRMSWEVDVVDRESKVSRSIGYRNDWLFQLGYLRCFLSSIPSNKRVMDDLTQCCIFAKLLYFFAA